MLQNCASLNLQISCQDKVLRKNKFRVRKKHISDPHFQIKHSLLTHIC